MGEVLKKKIASIILLSALLCNLGEENIAVADIPSLPIENITTPGIIQASLTAVDCFDYCVVGMCVWLRCSVFGCYVDYSILVRHYTPELVVSTFPYGGDNPWTEMDALIGLQNDGLQDILAASVGVPFSGGGSNIRIKDTSLDHSNVIYKDAEAFGHPLATTLNIFAGGDLVDFDGLISQYGGVTEKTDPVTGETKYTWDQPEGKDGKTYSETAIEGAMNIAGLSWIKEYLDALELALNVGNEIDKVKKVIDKVAELGGLGEAFNKNEFLCPTKATSFIPYFISAWDYYPWRWGVTDLLSPASWVPGLREVGSGLAWTWGPVMPRSGFVIQHSEPKAAAVLTQRVADIVTRKLQPHIYLYLGDVEEEGVLSPGPVMENDERFKWQMLVPEKSLTCEVFGWDDRLQLQAMGDGKVSHTGRYVFALWRENRCCTNRSGILIATIETPPICLY